MVTPHSRLNLGPTQALRLFLEQQVVRLSLEELSQEPNLDPLLNLLTRADDLIPGGGSARRSITRRGSPACSPITSWSWKAWFRSTL